MDGEWTSSFFCGKKWFDHFGQWRFRISIFDRWDLQPASRFTVSSVGVGVSYPCPSRWCEEQLSLHPDARGALSVLCWTACGRKDPVIAAMIAAKPPWPDQCHRFWPLNSFWIYRTSQRCARGACKALREHLWPRVHGSVVMCGNGVFTAFACMPLYNFVGEHLWTTRWSGSSV